MPDLNTIGKLDLDSLDLVVVVPNEAAKWLQVCVANEVDYRVLVFFLTFTLGFNLVDDGAVFEYCRGLGTYKTCLLSC